MGRREGSRIKWTEEMNDTVLQCKSKAVKLAKGDNPPRSENGRKIGYMSLMKDMWDELGYGHLALSSQNLRDKAAALERTVGNVSRNIVRNVGRADGTRSEKGNEENAEIVAVESSDQNANELRRRESANLHTESTQDSVEEIVNTLTTPEKELFERSSQLLASVNASEGDYSIRAIDTRIKQTPTKSDLKTINKVINGLVAQNKVVPGENPFAYLWLANCVLYSVVVTFLVSKGWKKDPKDKATRRAHENDSWRNKFLEIVGEVRKKLSIATAELSRIKENRKLTKRGKKNRSLLQKECRSLSASSLVSYIEKQKSLLRKLKVSFGRKRRQEEAKVLNHQFKEDPGRVYATITMMAEEDPDNARPKYKVARNEDQTSASKGVFSDIVEAEGFWRRLWEERGTGDENAEWLKEIELAISQHVPLPTVGTWTLETNEAVKVILKKRNWSAPGPDRVVNYWWNRACTLHEGVASAFKTITSSSCEYPKWFTEGKTRLIPKQADFTSENQRPITCLNTSYKWFTSCVLGPMDKHLKVYDLMEKQQRGAKAECSGTTDNLQIDRTVTLDCHRHKRNLSVAWVDVRKASDSVDHRWLNKIMLVHRFPVWICEVVRKLCAA